MRLRPKFPWNRLSPYGISLIIDDSSIDSSKIADCAVSTQAIQDSAIDSSKLQDCAVTYNAIQNVTAQRLLAREDAVAGSPQEVALSAELRFDTDNDWLEIADCGITVNLIKDSAVDSTKIADSAVSAANLADSSVDSSKLVDCGVNTQSLQDSSVDSTKLADSAVSSAGIQDGTIVASDFYDTNIVTRLVEIHATDTTLATGDTLATFFVPAELDSFDLVRAEAAVKVFSTSGRPTIQIRDVTGSADMMSTKITIDSGEKTSYTSDTVSVVDTTNDTVFAGQEIAIDIDSAGTGTEDLYVILSFRKT